MWRGSSGGFDLGEGIALDPSGNALLVGISRVDDNQDIVLTKLDPAGTLAWSRRVDMGTKDRGEDVAVDDAGNAYVGGTVNTLAGDDVLVLKYSPDGELLWSVTLDRGTSESVRGIALAPGGDILVGGVSLSVQGADGFVARWSPSGELRWARPINLYALDEVFDVAADAEGSALVTGRVLRDGDLDLLARKYDADGSLAWTLTLPRPGRNEGRGLAVDPRGHAFIAGTSEEAAGTDLLLVELDAEGRLVATRTLDIAGGADEGRDVVLDAVGNLHVTGFAERGGDKDPFLLKLAPDGATLWNASWHGDGLDGAGTLAITSDGARVVVGGASQAEGDVFDLLVLSYAPGRPTAVFDVATGAPERGSPVRFEERSAPGKAPLAAWRWDFGDGNGSSAQNPTHAYDWGGDYAVTLDVSDAWGATHRASRVVHVAGATRSDEPPAIEPAAPGLGEADAAAKRSAPAMPLAVLVGSLLAAFLGRRRR